MRAVEVVIGIGAHVVPIGPQMIVDDIKNDSQTSLVRGVHEASQVIGRSVGSRRGINRDAVVTPVPVAGEVRDWHQFDRVDADPFQVIESRSDRRKGPFLRKGADVQFVNYQFAEGYRFPCGICPAK